MQSALRHMHNGDSFLLSYIVVDMFTRLNSCLPVLGVLVKGELAGLKDVCIQQEQRQSAEAVRETYWLFEEYSRMESRKSFWIGSI